MKLVIHGIVQGVGFRPTVHRIARSLDLRGYVQNNGSNVIVEIEGDGDAFLRELKAGLPPLARIDRIEQEEGDVEALGGIEGFIIVPSKEGQRGIGIPNDVALCDSCRRELLDPSDRRYLYPFTNCTDCGARFTVIEDLPYDRGKTSMREFPMCEECRDEYSDPDSRRFHHQTISCPKCGPRYHLLDENGDEIAGEPIAEFAARIDDGDIGVAKSWGGMHICCSMETIPRLREWYGRKHKPFAIMIRDLKALEAFGSPTEHEIQLLTSPHRPVTLVSKNRSESLEWASPGLNNIGIFLPYTAMHEVLFHHLDTDSVVMTSANIPGEPMMLDDRDVLSLGADSYLLHNRRIVNRCDDSVVRSFDENTQFIRRSRGNIPASVESPFEGRAVGIGAQENLTAAIAMGGHIYPTQYVGEGDSIGVIEFLEQAVRYQTRLLGLDSLEAVGMDLHPGYSNRRLGKVLGEEYGAEIVEIQHHWAHASSLMVDSGENELIALTLDGTGYGADGEAWGGEVLHTTFEEYDRVGHLEEIPLLGGEKAVRDVGRLLFAFSELNGRHCDLFEEGEANIFRKMMDGSLRTSSFGRILDTLSCYLEVCRYRSYDGEPAMKLEALLERGKKVHDFEVGISNGVVRTVPMFGQLFETRGKREDLALSFVSDLLNGLLDVALESAETLDIQNIGLTGGVAYNGTISGIVRDRVCEVGMNFIGHDKVPNGDGGISTGQVAIALSKIWD